MPLGKFSKDGGFRYLIPENPPGRAYYLFRRASARDAFSPSRSSRDRSAFVIIGGVAGGWWDRNMGHRSVLRAMACSQASCCVRCRCLIGAGRAEWLMLTASSSSATVARCEAWPRSSLRKPRVPCSKRRLGMFCHGRGEN